MGLAERMGTAGGQPSSRRTARAPAHPGRAPPASREKGKGGVRQPAFSVQAPGVRLTAQRPRGSSRGTRMQSEACAHRNKDDGGGTPGERKRIAGQEAAGFAP